MYPKMSSMILAAFFLAITFFLLFKSIYSFIWIPYKLQDHFKKQGLRGPPRHPINGNAGEARKLIAEAQSSTLPLGHGIVQRVIPRYDLWSKEYGKTFLYWFGLTPRIAVAEPNLIKEVLLNSSGAFEKLSMNPLARQLLGNGVVNLKGEKWAQHRKIVSLNPSNLDWVSSVYYWFFNT
ncbi:hypothetical protein ACLOJK_009062 [Asimina triloba]